MITNRNRYYGPLVQQVAKTVFIAKDSPVTDADLGKPLTAVTPDTADRGPLFFKLAAAGDEIHGFLTSVEKGTLQGHQYVGMMDRDYISGVVTDDVVPGAIVELDTVPAAGTAGPAVFKAAADPATVVYKWRAVDYGVLERV